MKRTFVALLLCCSAFSLALLQAGCRSTPPGPNGGPRFGFEAVDASCTEVWLRITLDSSIQPRTLTLKRDDEIILSDLHPLTSDTLIVDEGLLPNQSYTYTLIRPTGVGVNEVKTAQITTMDTTSSNWVFQVDTLGASASVLYDVAIISEDNIWAVGELYLIDSATGQLDPNRYNAARWDGTRWNIIRIPYIYQGTPIHSSIRTLWAFSQDNIWFSNSVRWNGQQFENVDLAISIFTGVAINKMWGSPSGDLYVVGNSGTIAHRNTSGTWRRVESGTQLHVYDVWGVYNMLSGGWEIMAVASNVFINQGVKLFRISSGLATELDASGLQWGVNAIWFSGGKRYYVVGPGVYQKRSLQDPIWIRYPPGQPTSFFSAAIRGIQVNQVFVVGSFGEVVYFNGIGWKKLEILGPSSTAGFGAISLADNLVAIVGGESPRALAVIGRKANQQ